MGQKTKVTMFSQKYIYGKKKKQRHLNLRMNPRVSCDCGFFPRRGF